MYLFLKKIINKLVQKDKLFRIESTLRYLYSIAYLGKKYKCNICNTELRNFVNLKNDKLCPRCGSIQRNRRLWQILRDTFLNNRLSILDFSPSRCLYRVMKSSDYNYLSTDLSNDFFSDVAFDITNIDSKSESFNLILCYHILEHIEDDLKAMKELWRVLNRDGFCIIQTPFKDGEIYEDYSIKSPEERKKHFGQSDHVRIYSIKGLKSRLEQVGFEVKVWNFTEKANNYYGFGQNESILICHKQF